MEKEQAEEFFKLQKQVEDYLRHADGRLAGLGRFVMQILIIPSFDPSIGFDLYKQSDHASGERIFTHLLSQTIWRMDIDVSKFQSPVERLKHPRQLPPTFDTKQVQLDQTLAESVITKFTSVQIPAMLEHPSTIGLDGTSYEVAFGSYMVSARYGWWQTPPDEWQELSQATQETI